ncbi:MAG: hypothetical protein ACL7BU_08775 [Candidatus Phlomobacter fragariae]
MLVTRSFPNAIIITLTNDLPPLNGEAIPTALGKNIPAEPQVNCPVKMVLPVLSLLLKNH